MLVLAHVLFLSVVSKAFVLTEGVRSPWIPTQLFLCAKYSCSWFDVALKCFVKTVGSCYRNQGYEDDVIYLCNGELSYDPCLIKIICLMWLQDIIIKLSSNKMCPCHHLQCLGVSNRLNGVGLYAQHSDKCELGILRKIVKKIRSLWIAKHELNNV